jgi:hypothetical protein
MPSTESSGITPRMPASHAGVYEYVATFSAWPRFFSAENVGASASMMSPSTKTLARARTKDTTAYDTLLRIGVRIVPRNAMLMPTIDMPMIDASGPIAASGTMYPM